MSLPELSVTVNADGSASVDGVRLTPKEAQDLGYMLYPNTKRVEDLRASVTRKAEKRAQHVLNLEKSLAQTKEENRALHKKIKGYRTGINRRNEMIRKLDPTHILPTKQGSQVRYNGLVWTRGFRTWSTHPSKDTRTFTDAQMGAREWVAHPPRP